MDDFSLFPKRYLYEDAHDNVALFDGVVYTHDSRELWAHWSGYTDNYSNESVILSPAPSIRKVRMLLVEVDMVMYLENASQVARVQIICDVGVYLNNKASLQQEYASETTNCIVTNNPRVVHTVVRVPFFGVITLQPRDSLYLSYEVTSLDSEHIRVYCTARFTSYISTN